MTAAIGTELRGSPDTATRYATIHLNRGAAPTSRSVLDPPSAGDRNNPVAAHLGVLSDQRRLVSKFTPC